MITNNKITEVSTYGVGQQAEATIKPSAKLFDFFAKQIYADKYVAIWRELVANGIDAQKVSGSTKSPEVTLPSYLEPEAKVRDFGTGMGHEFMMSKFMAFTDASTKENSNEFIGGFGIGSKAPLAYTEQYSIKCFQEGVCRIYSVFKNKDGCPAIAFLSEDDTDEPNGVEVSFPVRQDDIQKFNEVVRKTLQYFSPLPTLLNTELVLEPIQYVAEAEDGSWAVRNEGSKAKAVIGGVAYDLDTYLSYSEREKYPNVSKMSGIPVDFFLPIGSVNIALSREHITHDDTLYEVIEANAANVYTSYEKSITEQFDACETLWQAKALYYKMLNIANHSFRSIVNSAAKYDGKPMSTFHIPTPADINLSVIAYGDYNNEDLGGLKGTKADSPNFKIMDSFSSFSTKAFQKIILADTKDRPILRVRRVIAEANDIEKFLVIRNLSEGVTFEQILDRLGNPPKDLIAKLSEYEPLPTPKRAPSTAVKNYLKVFISDSVFGPSINSNCLDALPSDGGVYIEMNNFTPLSDSGSVKTMKLLDPKNIIWLNKSEMAKSGVKDDPEWLSVNEAIQKVKSTYKSKNKRLAMASAVYVWRRSRSSWIKFLECLPEYSNFPTRGPLVQLLNELTAFNDVDTFGDQIMRTEILNIKYEKQTEKLEEIYNEAMKKHPFLFEYLSKTAPYLRESFTQEFVNNLI